jgi:hypothetical protein
MLESKHGRARELSAFRVILITLLYQFVKHWPPYPWGVWEWATFAGLLVALPLSDLLMAVPAKEALLALTSIFGSMVAKRTSHSESTSTTEEAVHL